MFQHEVDHRVSGRETVLLLDALDVLEDACRRALCELRPVRALVLELCVGNKICVELLSLVVCEWDLD